jgi:hypothetical protein
MLVVLPGSVAANDSVAGLALRDQFGDVVGLEDGTSGLQVAIVVSAKRLRRIKPWEQALKGYDGDLPVIRVADVPRTAPTEYETVAETLRKRLPEDVNVLVDLEGLWASRFELDTSVPNVLIFNGSGELLSAHRGMYKRALFEGVEADLQRLGESLQSP